MGVWVEVTTLLIPDLNDSKEELRDIAGFIRSLGEETPWHVTAFYPTYRMTDRPRTPISTLQLAREIGLEEGLRYVYSGNVPGEEGEHTICYGCGRVLVERYGYRIVAYHIREGRCVYCGREIDGIGV
jgi:pyruvate formate lyase activating enzyme